MGADPQLDDIIDRLKNTPYPNRNRVGVKLANGTASASDSDVRRVYTKAIAAKLRQITAIDDTQKDYRKKPLDLSGGKQAAVASVVLEVVDSIVNPITDENVPAWASDARAVHDVGGNFFLLLAPTSPNVPVEFRLAQPSDGVLALEITVGDGWFGVYKITAHSPGPFPTTVREFMGRLLNGRDKTIEPRHFGARQPGSEMRYSGFSIMLTMVLSKSGLLYHRDNRDVMVSGAFVDMAI